MVGRQFLQFVLLPLNLPTQYRAATADIHFQKMSGLQQVSSLTQTNVSLLTLFTGGWWSRPHNWKSNTAIAFVGILGLTYATFSVSAEKEVRLSVKHCGPDSDLDISIEHLHLTDISLPCG